MPSAMLRIQNCAANSSLLFPSSTQDQMCSARPAFFSSQILETDFSVVRKRRLQHTEEDDGFRMQCQSLLGELPTNQRRRQEDHGSYFKERNAQLASKTERPQSLAERRRRREVERQRFRSALEGMQKTVDIDENKDIANFLRRFEYTFARYGRTPLERLGLFLKGDAVE